MEYFSRATSSRVLVKMIISEIARMPKMCDLAHPPKSYSISYGQGVTSSGAKRKMAQSLPLPGYVLLPSKRKRNLNHGPFTRNAAPLYAIAEKRLSKS